MSADLDVLHGRVRNELARRRLTDFASLMDPHWESARHLQLIAEKLEDLEQRRIRRLLICLPPRHGKTELVSRKFIAWWMGRNPRDQVILASYGGELAEGNSRVVRSMVSDEAFPFPGVRLREDSRSVGRWETDKGGVLVAVGVGGGLTGRGGDLIVCDDLVKGREEAESEAIRASTASWFSDVLLTRAHPNAAIVMIGTRWHEADVIGEVLNSAGADGWTKIMLPLIAEDEDDVLGRKPGDLLWPERFSVDDIPSPERGEISSRSFAALYQQRPSPAAGNIFQRAWFEQRYTTVPTTAAMTLQERRDWSTMAMIRHRAEPIPATTVMGIDCASKTGVGNDFSVLATVTTDRVNFHVIDIVRERLEFGDLMRKIVETAHRLNPSRIFIEDASAGIAIVQELQQGTRLPIIPVPPRGSKIARAEAMTPIFESRRVLLPERAPWVEGFIDELCSFPSGRHDDQVDAVVLALAMLEATIARQQQDRRNAQILHSFMGR